MMFQVRREGTKELWSARGVDTLLLDLDGTLFDTFRPHWRSYRAALKKLNISYTLTWKDFFDINIRQNGKFELLIPGVDKQTLYKSKTDYFISELNKVRPAKGALQLIGALRQKGGRYAIVTGSRRGTVNAVLERCWQASGPDIIVTYEDVRMSKPSPECYFVAMTKLSRAATQCIAIEDAPSGVTSAQAAGLPCLAVRSVYFRQDDFPAGTLFLDSFADLSIYDD